MCEETDLDCVYSWEADRDVDFLELAVLEMRKVVIEGVSARDVARM